MYSFLEILLSLIKLLDAFIELICPFLQFLGFGLSGRDPLFCQLGRGLDGSFGRIDCLGGSPRYITQKLGGTRLAFFGSATTGRKQKYG